MNETQKKDREAALGEFRRIRAENSVHSLTITAVDKFRHSSLEIDLGTEEVEGKWVPARVNLHHNELSPRCQALFVQAVRTLEHLMSELHEEAGAHTNDSSYFCGGTLTEAPE